MRKITVAAVLCFCFVPAAQIAQAQTTVRVGGWSLRANGQIAQGFEYTGFCPVDLEFGWGLISDRPTQIAYTFVRSDGGRQSTSSFDRIPQANRSMPVYYKWRLGENNPRFANYSGSVTLMLQAPNSLEKAIHFTIHCQ